MRKLLILAVFILATANVAYWMPSWGTSNNSTLDRPILSEKLSILSKIQSLELVPLNEEIVERDLFSVVKPSTKELQRANVPAKELVKKIQPENIRQTPKVNLSEALNKYTLVGVLVRNGIQTAYILDGTTPVIAKVGEAVDEGVVITSIRDSIVVIKDNTTGIEKHLRLSGE